MVAGWSYLLLPARCAWRGKDVVAGLVKAQSGHCGSGARVAPVFSPVFRVGHWIFALARGGRRQKKLKEKNSTKKSYLAGCGFCLVVLFPRLSSGLRPRSLVPSCKLALLHWEMRSSAYCLVL